MTNYSRFYDDDDDDDDDDVIRVVVNSDFVFRLQQARIQRDGSDKV